MSIFETIDTLFQELLLFDSADTGRRESLITLLDSLDYEGIDEWKKRFISHLDAAYKQADDSDSDNEIDAASAVLEDIKKIIAGELKPDEAKIAGNDVTDTNLPAENEPASLQADVPAEKKSLGGVDLEIIDIFLEESDEFLDSIEVCLVDWEEHKDDSTLLDSIYRSFHSIKGNAGFANLIEIAKTAHLLEDLLDETRKGRLVLSREISDAFFDGVDVIKDMVSAVKVAVRDSSQPVYHTEIVETLRKRISLFLDLAEQGSEGNTPNVHETHVGDILVREGKISEDTLDEALEKQSLEKQMIPIGEMLVEEHAVTRRDVRDAIKIQSTFETHPVEKNVRVDTEKMDLLIELVGELVISQSMIANDPVVVNEKGEKFRKTMSQLARITQSLQSVSMSMRMVPIGSTFQKMKRIVRDYATKHDKKINLLFEGESSEIDRNMVDELYDPLMHIVRNSCDHGIESAEERREKGKAEIGTLKLKAEHGSSKVIITISDDGKGLDRIKILEKARERGLEFDEDNLDENAIDNLILMPGLSTADTVTDVSGRGVGMDVVRKVVEKMRGTISISSRKDQGTTLVLQLPLTTAIIDGILVSVSGEIFVIPTVSVRQMQGHDRNKITTITGKVETVVFMDELIPVMYLNAYYGLPDADEETSQVMVVVEDSGVFVGLIVDALLGKQEVVIKSVGAQFNDIEGISGCAILGSGQLGMIIDVYKLITFD